MLLFLSSHRDFDKMVEKYIPAKDLATIRDTVASLKTKVRLINCSCSPVELWFIWSVQYDWLATAVGN